MPRLVFMNNEVLPEHVYLYVLQLSLRQAAAYPSPERMAGFIESTFLSFLKDSGYALASVHVEAKQGFYLVDVDEGRLDSIVFPNQGVGHQIQFKMALSLPGDVFNASVLDRKIAKLVAEQMIESAEYEVVPVNKAPQEEVWAGRLIQGLRLVEASQPHELHIYINHFEHRPGLSAYLNYGSPDGLRLGLKYRGRDFLLEGDRYVLLPMASLRVFEGVVGGRQSVGFSRLSLEASYYSPPILDGFMSFLTWASADLHSLRRQDISVERYIFTPLRAALGLALHPIPHFSMSLGGGIQYRGLSGVTAMPGETIPVKAKEEGFSLFAGGELRLVLNPGVLRRDREHELWLRGIYTAPRGDLQGFLIAAGRYDKVLLFDYDEFWIRLSGHTAVGTPPFYDEISLGDELRVAFGATYAVHAGGLGLEYRRSVLRDLVKFSLFNDVSVFEDRSVNLKPKGVAVADNFGVGVHLLLLDAFQLNFYLGVGLSSTETAAFGVGVQLTEAY